jgi:hypothetical protein
MPDKTQPNPPKATTTGSTGMKTLLPAGESGDPAVHKLLADLETARSNNDADGVKAARDALADLGYSAA